MFGFYRTFLALMVVALHIGGIPWLGNYAVYGFYMLSGYLMTMIMQRTYGYSLQGVTAYLFNRFLRIYPLYWLSIGLSLLLFVWLGESYMSAYHKEMIFPQTWQDIVKNVFLLFPNLETARLTPPAWALTVELCFYVLIALGLSKHVKITLFWLGVSVVYHIVAQFLGWDRYFSVFAASLPFALGSVLYFYRNDLLQKLFGKQETLAGYLPVLILFLMFINWYVGYLLTRSHELFFYTNILLCALMLLVLSNYKSLPLLSKKADSSWGDFSYPIYLMHYQVALVVLVVLQAWGIDIQRPDILLMWVTIPFVFLAAWLLVIAIERPIEQLRAKVKEKL
ncbi:acyltransferase family protein [Ghiorsea bivora]|uniref:acyltransferase family protein n=1 Tax=Ghiorsea bivora TaxID=1485545 RepID=UPI00056F9AC9|nr:acyltransferase [Ghiorsea bivora]